MVPRHQVLLSRTIAAAYDAAPDDPQVAALAHSAMSLDINSPDHECARLSEEISHNADRFLRCVAEIAAETDVDTRRGLRLEHDELTEEIGRLYERLEGRRRLSATRHEHCCPTSTLSRRCAGALWRRRETYLHAR
jgi:hypothetical protein